MTKQEFLNHVNELLPEKERINVITDEEYAVVELVYTFHPAISNTDGRKQIAELYVRYGWSVIMDMKPRAERMVAKEKELADAESALLAIEQDMDILRGGGWA